MKSAHCQVTVTNAVKANGGTIRSVAPAKADIELSDGITRQAIVKAIEKAGYRVA